jgi:DNA-binding response OmpR family regulator
LTVSTTGPTAAKVLIVDQSDECREVLSTVLRQRGFQTIEAAEARQGLEMLHLHRPQLVVLDLDTESAREVGVRSQYSKRTEEQNAQLLVLGRALYPGESRAGNQVIAKPYHFAPLIRTIEELLNR